MAAGNVPRFSVQEVAIERPVSGNPFAEDVALVVRRPDGEERRVPAFYDGGDVWRVRLAPDVVGRWTAHRTRRRHPPRLGAP